MFPAARVNKLWFQRENMLRVIDMLSSGSHCATNTIGTSRRWRWRGYYRQSELPISILSGATSPEQVRENIAALSITLTDDDALLMTNGGKR